MFPTTSAPILVLEVGDELILGLGLGLGLFLVLRLTDVDMCLTVGDRVDVQTYAELGSLGKSDDGLFLFLLFF